MPEGEPSSTPAATSERHVIIVGAGIGGLNAALFMAKAGWRVTVAERAEELKEFGAGIQLAPNATRLLADIGILDDLKDFAVRSQALVVRKGESGQELSRVVLGEDAEKRYGWPFITVHRADLQDALRHRAEAHPAITLRLGLSLVDVQEKPDEIIAFFSEGDKEVRITGDLVVGADGVWSRARTLAGLPGPSRYSGNTAWRALVPREQVPLFARESKVNLWFGGGLHLVHYPICGGEAINIVAVVEDHWHEPGWSCPGDPDALAKKFEPWCEKAHDLVASADEWKRWALVRRAPESRWSRPRMTLLGDAAHPMSPFLAQGAASAIEDGAALATLLTNPTPRPEQLALALRRYDALRIPRTARIQDESRRQGQLYHFSGLVGRARDTALRLLPGQTMLSRFSWIFNYDARNISV